MLLFGVGISVTLPHVEINPCRSAELSGAPGFQQATTFQPHFISFAVKINKQQDASSSRSLGQFSGLMYISQSAAPVQRI